MEVKKTKLLETRINVLESQNLQFKCELQKLTTTYQSKGTFIASLKELNTQQIKSSHFQK